MYTAMWNVKDPKSLFSQSASHTFSAKVRTVFIILNERFVCLCVCLRCEWEGLSGKTLMTHVACTNQDLTMLYQMGCLLMLPDHTSHPHGSHEAD